MSHLPHALQYYLAALGHAHERPDATYVLLEPQEGGTGVLYLRDLLSRVALGLGNVEFATFDVLGRGLPPGSKTLCWGERGAWSVPIVTGMSRLEVQSPESWECPQDCAESASDPGLTQLCLALDGGVRLERGCLQGRWFFGLTRALVVDVLRPLVPRRLAAVPRRLDALRVGILQRVEGGRRLANAGALLAHLDSLPGIARSCVAAFDGETPFEAQVAFFRDNDVVISPHGAQMVSVPFMEDFGLLVEVVHPWHWAGDYFHGLTLPARVHHARITDDSLLSRGRGDKRCDVSISPSALDAVLDAYRSHERARTAAGGSGSGDQVLGLFGSSP